MRQTQYKEAVGFLAAMAGKLPHEVFESPDWNKTLIFDLEVSQLFWKKYFALMKQ